MMILSAGLLVATVLAQAAAEVNPADLARNRGLIGKEVVVDDRIRFFLAHRDSRGASVYDELSLRRTDVPFRLPKELRPSRPPRMTAAIVRGIVKSEGRLVYVDVTGLELIPSDGERLESEVGKLTPRDFQGRRRWADWAAVRGHEFTDGDLLLRSKDLEEEAMVIEAAEPKSDALALAEKSLVKKLGTTLVGALVHQGARARLKSATRPEEFLDLASRLETLIPSSTKPVVAEPDLTEWRNSYEKAPLETYRKAPREVRAALDRNLAADAIQKGFELAAAQRPADALKLADQAKSRLPDRPEVAKKLGELGLRTTESKLDAMRLSDVETLAQKLRGDGRPDQARSLLKSWLVEQRKSRLSPGDLEGRLRLVDLFERLIEDQASGEELLAEAAKIDPESRLVADAYRRRGFRKAPDGAWRKGAADLPAAAVGEAASALSVSGNPLRGLTKEQVIAKLGGKPSRIMRVAGQDVTIEQWIYQGARGTQVVNFRLVRGGNRAEVAAYYTIP